MSRSKAKFILIGTQIVYVLSILVWLLAFGVSVMGLGSPGAAEDTATLFIFFYVLVYPLGLLAAIIGSWVKFARHNYPSAMRWNMIPLLWIIPAIILVIYGIFI